MVDIIHNRLRVDQLNQVLNDLDNILFRQHTNIITGRQSQLLVDTITTDITQVITFLREEQVRNDFSCTGVISRLSVSQLTINIQNGLFLGVTRVLLQCIVNNSIVGQVLVLAMEQDILRTRFQDRINAILIQYGLTVNNYGITLNRNYLTGILIDKVLRPCLQHTSSQLTANILFQVLTCNLNLLCQVKDLKNVFIALKPDSTQQGRYR